MSLINTARALDDIRFKWRVRAALLRTAAIRKDSQLAEEIDYATFILRNPMIENPQLEALCAVDPGVIGKVVVDENSTVSTEAVKDETLIYLAEVNFAWLARNHTQTPAPGAWGAATTGG